MHCKKKRTGKTLVYNYDDNTIRGSFINQVLTGTIITLIVIAVLTSNEITDRLVRLTELITLVFFISFGGWKASQYFYNKRFHVKDCKEDENNG